MRPISLGTKTTFAVALVSRGVKKGKTCVKPARGLKGKACSLLTSRGTFTRVDKAGNVSFAFKGKVGKKTLTAEKSFVTSAGEADSYVTSTLSSDAKDAVTSTLWLVANGARGVAVEGAFDGLGLRGNASAPMSLRDVEVADDARLSAPGQGFGVMMSVVLPWFQVGSAASSVGIAEAAFAITAAHLNKAKLEHIFLLHLEAFDWNCPQHITPRFTQAEIETALAPAVARLEQLEADNRALRQQLAEIKQHRPTPA